MKVKRLTMQSFRGIGDLTLEFPTDEPIVFIGINGVGKSSILDCLAILLSCFIGRIQFDPDSRTRILTFNGFILKMYVKATSQKDVASTNRTPKMEN